MEPAGLAVGIAELVGLFNTRLKVVERVNSYKSFKHDSHSLAVQFQAKKRRFEQWGSAVGINKGTLSSAHQPALDDPTTPSTAKDLLSLIHRVCANADDVASETFLLSNVNPAKRKLSVTNHVQPRGGASLNSLRRKIKLNSLAFWCSTCKTSFPPNGVKSTSTVYGASASGRGPGHLQDNSIHEGAWIPKFRHIVARLDGEITGKDILLIAVHGGGRSRNATGAAFLAEPPFPK